MPMKKVTPRKGFRIRTEDGSRHIAAEGEMVELTTYYQRRIDDGGLVTDAAGEKPSGKSAKR